MHTLLRTGRAKLPVLAGLTIAAAGTIIAAERPGLLHAAPLASDSAKAFVRAGSSGVAKLEDLSDAFATVAARVRPSVVVPQECASRRASRVTTACRVESGDDDSRPHHLVAQYGGTRSLVGTSCAIAE